MTEDFPPKTGGLAQWSENLWIALRSMDDDVSVITKGDIRRKDGCIQYLPDVLWQDTRGLRMLLALLPFVLRKRRLIVFVSTWIAGFPAAVLKLFFPFRLIVAVHGMELVKWKRAWHRLKMRFVFSSSDAIIAVSEYTKSVLTGMFPKLLPKLKIVRNCVQLPASFDNKRYLRRFSLPKGRYIITVSRLVARKGIDTVIGVMPQLIRMFDDIYYIVAGDGEQRNRLANLAREKDVSDRVIFVGSVNGMERLALLETSSVFVMPVRRLSDDFEGFGISIIEAEAAGLPVVVGNSGGAPEALVDGKTGFVVDPESEEELIDRLSLLLSDEDVRRDMSEVARSFVEENYTLDIMRESLSNIIGGIIG